jgi:coiled-coil domain-containing protein 12
MRETEIFKRTECINCNFISYLQEILVNVAPKKPNWDLRRDIAKKLEKLERRTQRAMIQIMQEQERQQLDEAGGVQD